MVIIWNTHYSNGEVQNATGPIFNWIGVTLVVALAVQRRILRMRQWGSMRNR